MAMSLVFILVIFPHFSITTYADKINKADYNIQLEMLSNTAEAKELNKYRKKFLNYFNEQAKKERQASGNNSYELLKSSDLDFTDNSKVSGIKRRGSYYDYEYYAKYEDFVKSLQTNDFWYLSIIKGNTLYAVAIFKSDNPEKYGDNVYKIGGNWYIHSCDLYLKSQNWTGALIYNADVIRKNVENLLEYYNVEGKNIQVILTDIGGYWTAQCAIVFVDGMATYIYANNFRIPYNNLKNDTPKEVQEALSECASGLYRGSYEQETTEIKRFRDYNMVMSLFILYEYYKAV